MKYEIIRKILDKLFWLIIVFISYFIILILNRIKIPPIGLFVIFTISFLILGYPRNWIFSILDKKYLDHDYENFKEYKKEIRIIKQDNKKGKDIFELNNSDFDMPVQLKIKEGTINSSIATMKITPKKYMNNYYDENIEQKERDEKGEGFENYFLSKLIENNYDIEWITPSKTRFTDKPTRLKIESKPDLKIKSKLGTFWIECKLRKNWERGPKGGFKYSFKEKEIKKYSNYNKEYPLFFAVGIGIKEQQENKIIPEEVYLFQFRLIKKSKRFYKNEYFRINLDDKEKTGRDIKNILKQVIN